MKKYEFTEETKVWLGRTLHRIKAIVSFGSVQAGELGGWIEKESNLDHDGNAWVYDDARVFDNARVSGDAKIYGDARVFDNARVSGNARVFGNAKIYGNARVFGNAKIYGNARVFGNARVYGRKHILLVSMIGSRDDTVTFMRSKEKKIIVAVGCFRGTIDEFEKAVRETHGDNEHAKAYMLTIELAKLRIDLSGEVEEEGEQG